MVSFKEFLNGFIPQVERKTKQVNQATWILETTGIQDAAELKAELEVELRLLFNEKAVFEKLLSWDRDSISDPLLKRQLNVLIRMFKPNLIDKELLKKIAQEEANLALLYSNFRPEINGKTFSENDIREILKKETDVTIRKATWEASKQIGKVLAPHILKLVHLRNEAANQLGYRDYFSMQLELQEVDEAWLFDTFDALAKRSDSAYLQLINQIDEQAAKHFSLPKTLLGPWAWSEPFCQEDPLDAKELDNLVKDIDLIETAKQFYHELSFDVNAVLQRSDNFERLGKNQHAFCMNIDRKGDVRTLNNIKPTIKWLETVLHELGHAVYELGYSKELPWLLKEPPHMLTTEAMALLAGRQAYRTQSLKFLTPHSEHSLKKLAETSLGRRQLIFSRWVLVMTYFERELYRNPNQNLNLLWWQLVWRFQKIKSAGSTHGADWAAKYHLGLAPVYYFSYLLGELFASSLEENMPVFSSRSTGIFLNEKLFKPGNSFDWQTLIKHTTGQTLTADAWLSQFA